MRPFIHTRSWPMHTILRCVGVSGAMWYGLVIAFRMVEDKITGRHWLRLGWHDRSESAEEVRRTAKLTWGKTDVQDLSDPRCEMKVEGKMPSGALKQARQTAILEQLDLWWWRYKYKAEGEQGRWCNPKDEWQHMGSVYCWSIEQKGGAHTSKGMWLGTLLPASQQSKVRVFIPCQVRGSRYMYTTCNVHREGGGKM